MTQSNRYPEKVEDALKMAWCQNAELSRDPSKQRVNLTRRWNAVLCCRVWHLEIIHNVYDCCGLWVMRDYADFAFWTDEARAAVDALPEFKEWRKALANES